MFELKSADATRQEARTIVPFPDTHPDVSITMREIPPRQVRAIWDSCGIRPGNNANTTWAQWDKANKILVKKSIESWTGFSLGGQELECTDDNKVLLLDENVSDPDDPSKKVSAWQVILAMFEKAIEADRKN